MRTMFLAQENIYTDCEGRYTKFVTMGKFDTIEEAREKVKTFPERDAVNTGDWQIVAKTMDEATFTITETVVEKYNWWDEVGRKKRH